MLKRKGVLNRWNEFILSYKEKRGIFLFNIKDLNSLK
jgi:hypothetical protein